MCALHKIEVNPSYFVIWNTWIYNTNGEIHALLMFSEVAPRFSPRLRRRSGSVASYTHLALCSGRGLCGTINRGQLSLISGHAFRQQFMRQFPFLFLLLFNENFLADVLSQFRHKLFHCQAVKLLLKIELNSQPVFFFLFLSNCVCEVWLVTPNPTFVCFFQRWHSAQKVNSES